MGIAAFATAVGLPLCGRSQEVAHLSVPVVVAGGSLDAPDAPGEQGVSPQAVQPEATGSVSANVQDVNGGTLGNAAIRLVQLGTAGQRMAVPDASGHFTFSHIPAGRYSLTVTSPGLETYVSPQFSIEAGEQRELPQITLSIASSSSSVEVTMTQKEIATEQIRSEEKQRVFGVLPNFYSSYIWDAAPMTSRQKFGLAAKATVDPTEFLGAGIAAGAQYYFQVFPGYGYGASGYAKRYAAAYGDGAITRMLGSAALPSILHQDPRYFYKGTGSKKSRALYAMSRAVVTRGDNGKSEPNYSHIAGALMGGAIAMAYHPAADRGAGLIFMNVGIDTAGNAVQGLIREFVLRDLTPHVPATSNGKP